MIVGASCDSCTRIAARFGIELGKRVKFRVWDTEFDAPVEAITHTYGGIMLILKDESDGTVFPVSIEAVVGLQRIGAA